MPDNVVKQTPPHYVVLHCKVCKDRKIFKSESDAVGFVELREYAHELVRQINRYTSLHNADTHIKPVEQPEPTPAGYGWAV